MLTLSFDALPEEVTDYAFDQFNDRIRGGEREAAEVVYSENPITMEYDSQTATLNRSIVTYVLFDAMAEKIRDIEYEIEHNERGDYDMTDVRDMQNQLEAIRQGGKVKTVPSESLEYVMDLVEGDIQNWFEDEQAEEAAHHIAELHQAIGNDDQSDHYQNLANYSS